MITILKTNIKKFTHIIQFGDIHIKLNTRHKEYQEVFKRFYNDIKSSPEETAVICCGDIFHTKIDLQPECIQMAADLFTNIANLRPLILVAGNHDGNLSNKHRLDSISPIVDALNHSNLFYLKKSGLYGMGNILINNMGVFDSPDKYILGKDIPKIYKNQYEYIVALYHGVVDGVSTETGYKLTNPEILPQIFDDHHIALLGDIHFAQNICSTDDEIVVSENDVNKYNMDLWDIIEEIETSDIEKII